MNPRFSILKGPSAHLPSRRKQWAALALSLASWCAWGQTAPAAAPKDVLSLSATASVDVTSDVLNVALSTTREGADAAAVQSQLAQALDAALAEARQVAVPGQVDVSTGNFALYPRYMPNGGALQWQGSAELQVSGRDTKAISQLVSRIRSLSVARVFYSLSREAREKAEVEVSAMAIKRFRDKALAYASQFGFTAIELREVQVGSDGPSPQPVMRMSAASPMAAKSADALPVEAGKITVGATVNGSVQMK